ncbi:MAG TPA: PilZ domain-containing protein [Terriglobales bacterium]|nr:PilZ domain-containing protein [Terriglobales bacterium]
MALTSLIVCPDASSVEVLQSILAALEIRTECHPDASPIQALLDHQPFDVIIVDFVEEREAAVILQRIRSSPVNRPTLVVALVGSENDVRQIFALGTNFVLYKPISPERARASLHAARTLMRRERRRSARASAYIPTTLDYANIEKAQATLLDLGEEGLSLQSEHKLPPRCRVYFQFNLPSSPALVRLSGEVVWQDSAGRVGIRFADVPQSSRRILRDWLRESLAVANNAGASAPAHSRPTPPAPQKPRPPASRADDGLARFRASPGNRRGGARHACRLGADVYRLGGSVPHRCSLSDISMGGCYVEMPSPFLPGQAVEIRVRTTELKLRVQGVVQAVHPGFGMGVQFTLRTSEDRDQVQHLIRLLAEVKPDASVGVGDPWTR